MESYHSPCQHVRQSDAKRNCGAACLSMLFRKHNKRGKLKDITEKISFVLPNGAPSCRNALMIKYARSVGFDCFVVSAVDLRSIITICLKNGIDIAVSYHTKVGAPEGHYSVVTGIDDEYVYVNDPYQDAPKGSNFPIEINDLIAKSQANEDKAEIVQNNTVLLLAQKSANLPLRIIKFTAYGGHYSTSVFECIADQIRGIVYPELDIWILAPSTPTNQSGVV